MVAAMASRPECWICGAPAVVPTHPVQRDGADVWACEACWARIGRWAVRMGVIEPEAGFLFEEPLSEGEIIRSREIAALHGLLVAPTPKAGSDGD